jgi:hypothetical protein
MFCKILECRPLMRHEGECFSLQRGGRQVMPLRFETGGFSGIIFFLVAFAKALEIKLVVKPAIERCAPVQQEHR